MKDYSGYTDYDLMCEIKSDNMLAFDSLYKRYGRRLHRFAFQILKSSEDAENILQDVFLNLWEHRNRIEKSESVRYYIFTLAYNASITVIRKKVREKKFLEYIKQQQLEENPVNLDLEFRDIKEKLDEIINHLPGRQREVYLKSRVDELKQQEIAELMNISVNTVENHMARALRTLRKKLGNYSLTIILYCYLFV
jgi:RNA polymerase sigma-70 factor (family 1)